MKRRTFLQQTALLSAALYDPAALFAKTPLLNTVGLGLFSLPKMLDTNFDAALSLLEKLGYAEVETYGPYPFSTDKAKASWNAVTPQLGFSGSGFYGRSAADFLSAAKARGLRIPSMHTDLDTLLTRMGPLAEAAHVLGARYVVLPAIPDEFRKTTDDYHKIASTFNSIGAAAKKEGIAFAYHNHGYGLFRQEGKMPIDIIFAETDPSLVYFEMDIFWTVAGGIDPIELLTKHKGRYKMMHVKDMKEKKQFSGDGGDARQWISLFPYMTACGNGVLPLREIIETARKNGTEHFFIEQDMVASPETALKQSIDYLKSL
jgi:sugar phosphate isomerase/epimerase